MPAVSDEYITRCTTRYGVDEEPWQENMVLLPGRTIGIFRKTKRFMYAPNMTQLLTHLHETFFCDKQLRLVAIFCCRVSVLTLLVHPLQKQKKKTPHRATKHRPVRVSYQKLFVCCSLAFRNQLARNATARIFSRHNLKIVYRAHDHRRVLLQSSEAPDLKRAVGWWAI